MPTHELKSGTAQGRRSVHVPDELDPVPLLGRHLETLGQTSIATATSVWRRLPPLAIVSAITAGVATYLAGGGTDARGVAVPMAALVAAACVAMTWTPPNRDRVAWAAMGLGTLLWCVAEGSRPVWQAGQNGLPASPLRAALPVIGATLLFTVGLIAHLGLPARPIARLRYFAEALMLASSLLFASWVIVMPAAFEGTRSMSGPDQALVLAHPLSNVLLLAMVAFAATRLPHLRWTPLLLAGVGTIALLTLAASSVSVDDAGTIGLLDVGTAVGFLAVLAAAVRSWRSAPTGDAPVAVSQPAQLLLLSAPGLSVLIVVGTTIRQATGDPVAADLAWITIGLLSVSVLLHLSVIFESHALGEELELARDEAIRGSLLKSNFLANVSHEIRTPMNAVIGLTGLLLDTELDLEQRELAIGVATSAEGLLDLIETVLDFSKIEAGKMQLEEIDLDLTDLLNDVTLIVGDSARRKGIDLQAYCEPGMVTTRRGDPLRLRQILLNLGNNAVKFTPEGSVTIQALPVAGDPDKVAFVVIDTGIGIPASEQARLFEPFSQLDESTTRNYGGTGLGLGIVSELVSLQSGTIELVSEVGRGTVFRITLPLPRSVREPAEQGLSALVGKRALVVDGNAVDRTVLADTLTTWGFVVDQASSAEEALHQFVWGERTPPAYAVALIEHRMTGMDGVELARVLRQQPATSDAVVFLLTSAAHLSRQGAHEAGIKSVLIKPVRSSYLLRRIVDALVTSPAPPAP